MPRDGKDKMGTKGAKKYRVCVWLRREWRRRNILGGDIKISMMDDGCDVRKKMQVQHAQRKRYIDILYLPFHNIAFNHNL